jgi:hypothetical protein
MEGSRSVSVQINYGTRCGSRRPKKILIQRIRIRILNTGTSCRLKSRLLFRFVSGKPLIDANTVPRFEFRFDSFRGRSFAEQLRAKIPMLPALLLAHSRQVKSPCLRFGFSWEKVFSCPALIDSKIPLSDYHRPKLKVSFGVHV